MTNSKLSSFVSSSFDFVAQSTSQRVCSQLCWPHVSYQTGQTESSQMFLLLGQKKNLAMKCLELNVCFCLFHLRFMHKALPSICVCFQLCWPHLWLPDRPAKKQPLIFWPYVAVSQCLSDSYITKRFGIQSIISFQWTWLHSHHYLMCTNITHSRLLINCS